MKNEIGTNGLKAHECLYKGLSATEDHLHDKTYLQISRDIDIKGMPS